MSDNVRLIPTLSPARTSSIGTPLTSPISDATAQSASAGTSTVHSTLPSQRLRGRWKQPSCQQENRPRSKLRCAFWFLSVSVFISFVLAARSFRSAYSNNVVSDVRNKQNLRDIEVFLQPSLRPEQGQRKEHMPVKWFRERSSHLPINSIGAAVQDRSNRPKAALISLVRNEELEGILQSMRQLEVRWNRRYQYPWIFFSETPFNDDFKAATSNASSGPTFYHLIPRAHWSTPDWVDRNNYHDSLTYLHTVSVGKGHLPSYRHMCRWNSGFFYQHPALAEYDYYWRVEPDVHFFCDIPYDPFRFIRDNEMVYGFNMNILDDARSFASLWRYTMRFVEENAELIHKDADLSWLIDEENGNVYNNCQFFSNFEVGSLEFFRAEQNTKFFQYLDEVAGGFFYERYGDAPIHTLSVALFAPKDRVWFFRDIGYQHDIARHCPADGVAEGRCACEPTGLDENFYKLVPMESPQRKPTDSCLRMWLGGEWLKKRQGWDKETEKLIGGDGYGGYLKDLV